jgi:hypothetical protein
MEPKEEIKEELKEEVLFKEELKGGMCKEKVLQSQLDGMFHSFSSSIIID